MTPEARRRVVLGGLLCGLQSKQLADFVGVHRSIIGGDRALIMARHKARDLPALMRAVWTKIGLAGANQRGDSRLLDTMRATALLD